MLVLVQVGQGYPHDPPKVKCETMVYHPNIDLEGNVCLNILRSVHVRLHVQLQFDWSELKVHSLVSGRVQCPPPVTPCALSGDQVTCVRVRQQVKSFLLKQRQWAGCWLTLAPPEEKHRTTVELLDYGRNHNHDYLDDYFWVWKYDAFFSIFSKKQFVTENFWNFPLKNTQNV